MNSIKTQKRNRPSYYREPTEKKCRDCADAKPIAQFHKAGKWRQSYCKVCSNLRAKLRTQKIRGDGAPIKRGPTGKRKTPPTKGTEEHTKLSKDINDLKTPEASKVFGISVSTLYKWIRNGKFTPLTKEELNEAYGKFNEVVESDDNDDNML